MRRKKNFHAKKLRIAVPYGNERTKKKHPGKKRWLVLTTVI